jgi:hypothetical protein
MADDSGFIVSESLTRSLNFRHASACLIIFKVKISGAGKYIALQQKRGYRASDGGADSRAAAEGEENVQFAVRGSQ